MNDLIFPVLSAAIGFVGITGASILYITKRLFIPGTFILALAFLMSGIIQIVAGEGKLFDLMRSIFLIALICIAILESIKK